MQVDTAPTSRRRARVFSADDVLNGDDNSGRTKRLRLLDSHSSSSLWSWDRIDEGNEFSAACSDDDDETLATTGAGAEAHSSMTHWWGPAEATGARSSSSSAAIDHILAATPLEESQHAMALELPTQNSSSNSDYSHHSGSSTDPTGAASTTQEKTAEPRAPPSPVSSQVLRGLEAISLRPGRKHNLRTSLLPPPGVRACPASFAVANSATTTQQQANSQREMRE